MIKITPISEHENQDKILQLYFEMVASVIPFYIENLEEGLEKQKYNCRKLSVKKTARRRTAGYKSILKKYHIKEPKGADTVLKIKNDAMLAAQIIKVCSPELYDFIYQGKKDGNVNGEKLCQLLTSRMDCLNSDSFNLDFKIEMSNELLQHVFRYEKFASHEQINTLIRLMGVAVCPYCNHNYITTVEKRGGIRAQLDHYLNKNNYPHLALSIYNLIPSCGGCNQRKSDQEERVIYPYAEEMGDSYVFETKAIGNTVMYLIGEGKDFEITGKRKEVGNSDFERRRDQSVSTFQLEELYREQKTYVHDLFLQRYVFDDVYLESICEKFSELFENKQEVKNMLYLKNIQKENWGKYPLAKLTHDIDSEISRLLAISRKYRKKKEE